MKKPIIVVVALVIAAMVLVYRGQKQGGDQGLFYSGTLEATQTNLAFQIGGRVSKVYVQEGQKVTKGQLLAELERAELQVRLEQAQGALSRARLAKRQAEIMLEIAEKSAPAEVARAEATLSALASQLDELQAGSRPQEIEISRQAMLATQTILEEAKKNWERFDRLFQKGIIAEKDWEGAKLRWEKAQRDHEQAQRAYELKLEGARPQTIETARARWAEAKALLEQAKSNLKRIEAARADVAAAENQIQTAQWAVDQAQIQLAYTRLTAPSEGIVTSRNVEPGEVVTPSREVITISDLSLIHLKIFVEETELGKIKIGQEVRVKIDTFPQKTYRGVVSYISAEGEFTPKMIQTRKERVKLVYLVKITLPNEHLELKSGMPADAFF